MKVYPVTKDWWESSEIVKVFDSQEKATKFIDQMDKIEKQKERWESQCDYNWYEFDVE